MTSHAAAPAPVAGPSAEDKLRLRHGLPDAQWMARARVPPQEMVLFCRQFSALTNTGVPIFMAMDVLARQASHPVMVEMLRTVAVYVESGYYLSQVATRFPNIFGMVWVTLLRVGENTGALARILDLLAQWLERDYEVRQRVKAALTYPTLVLVLALGACYFLMSVIAPGFLEMFEDQDDLPWITRAVAFFVHLQQQPWFWIALAFVIGGSVYGARRLWGNQDFRVKFYEWVTLFPVVGTLLETSAWARYFAAYGIMVKAGLSPLVSFPMAARASGDPRLEDDAPKLLAAIREGLLPSVHTRDNPNLYPVMVSYCFEVTETTGQQSDLIGYMERFYRLETEHRIDILSTLAEPFVLFIASSFVLILMLALMLPLYGQMGKLGP